MLRPLYEALVTRNTELVKSYRDVAKGIKVVTNIPTGLKSLDKMGVGQPGILTLIQGHPGDGKSAFVRQLLAGAAMNGYKPQAHIYEDPEEFICDGFTAKEMAESAFKLRRFELPLDDIEMRIKAAMVNLAWAKNTLIETEKMDSASLIECLMDTVTKETGVVAIDYLQTFDAEEGEKSVERIISRLCWSLLDVAKKKKIAVYAFSQIKKEVEDRGRRNFDNWMWRNQKGIEEMSPSDMVQAVEGYRPLSHDAQWSSQIYQRVKDAISIFRPGKWLRQHGIDAKDTAFELLRVKGNYSPSQKPIRLTWHGETMSIHEKENK